MWRIDVAESAVFDWACATLESGSTMTRLQARGTMRLVLKKAGLEPSHFTVRQLKVIATKRMEKELQARGIAEAAQLCAALADCPDSVAGDGTERPEDIFDRLGRKS